MAMAKEVRRRIKEISDDNLKLRIVENTKKKAQKISGNKRKGVYLTDVNKMPEHSLNAYKRVLNKFLASKQTTIEGREEIFEKAKESFFQNTPNITRKQASEILDLLTTDVYHKLKEKKSIESEKVMELMFAIEEVTGLETDYNIGQIGEQILGDFEKYDKLKEADKIKYIMKIIKGK